MGDDDFHRRRAEWIAETERQLRNWQRSLDARKKKIMSNETYGWFESAADQRPTYDPPHHAPCLYCGLSLTDDDVRTHSVMYARDADRSYFYRTHRTCDEAASDGQKQAIMGGVLDRISSDLGLAPGDPVR